MEDITHRRNCRMKRILSALTALCMAGALCACDQAKKETVYVLTDAKGNRTDTIVSNWLQNPDGLTSLPDISDLTKIENVKTNEDFTQNGDSLTWNTNGGDIYYKGHSDKELPIEMKVSYKLNGEDIEPEQLLGKSGKVTIRYDYKNLSSKEVEIGGKKETLYTPFVMATGLMLDGVKFSKRYGDLAIFLVDFHNGYLTVLVCAGLVGFILLGIFLVRFFASTTRHVLRDESLQQKAFPCLFSFLWAYMVYSLVEVTLLFNFMFAVVFFWLILGYTSCYLTKNMPDHPVDHVTIFGKQFRKTLF